MVIPPKIEDEIFIKLKRFEGNIDNNKNIEDILKYDPKYVEEIIFKHLKDTDNQNLNYLYQILIILGNFDTPRALLTLGKFSDPFVNTDEKEPVLARPRHIRVAAINAIMTKTDEKRSNLVIKHISDADPIFQSLVLKLLKDKEVKEAIAPAYETFKKSSTDALFKVKIDAATLIIALSTDPQLKNSVRLNMLIDPNIHIRKAGLTLLSEGGEPGDAEVRRKLIELLKNAKDEELELACKGIGTLKASEAKDDLITILNRENSPLIKWECLNSLYKINYDSTELNKKIKELIDTYKGKGNIKNADQERFQRLLDFINSQKEQK